MSKSRGEATFKKSPPFSAAVYDRMLRFDAMDVHYQELAQDLASMIDQGRLLDVGTGPGRLLLEIHRLKPDIELFGLDIAASMVQQAKKAMIGIQVDLRQGSIEHTTYADHFFDMVTATGSFYLWDRPEACLEEIHRILKPGHSACLYETHKDFDEDEFRRGLKANLQRENILRRWFMPYFPRKAIEMSYHREEIVEIVKRTHFADSFTIDDITLARLPIWLRIRLTKSRLS
jgi:ubiquinone/menaquinone biosynthesis C-methylase UbiE